MCVLLSNITQLFGHPLYCPWYWCCAISGLQRRFTKRLPTLKNLSYRERLKCLNLFSLELRRLNTDLFWCYKIVFVWYYVSLDDLFAFSPCQYTRGHYFTLYKRQTVNIVRANFFSERVINCWNSLSHTVDFNSFVSASLYFSKRGAYWDRLCRDVVGRWLVGWLVVIRVHCGQTVHPRPIVTMEH